MLILLRLLSTLLSPYFSVFISRYFSLFCFLLNRYAFPLFRDVIEKLHELMQEAFVKDAFTSKKVADEIKKDIKNSLQVAVEKA